ncbi:MAG: UvrD-helicase domain-containing protein [Rickettsiaceae bacterium]|nr:UvrD-helicase domain-containing protein [Rickettsiaceae bacterium]
MHNSEQILSSNPKYSVWLSSSAGAGKTKVLTDRVVRLLLDGISPHKILCLTFTNAAASEMLTRIHKLVNNWNNLSDNALKLELSKVIGNDNNDNELFIKARKLSEDLFQTKALKIYTIHAFCQKILKYFPREADLNPHFTIMSEITTKQIAQRLTFDLINASIETAELKLDQFHQYTLAEIVETIMSDSNVFEKKLFAQFTHQNEYRQYLLQYFRLEFQNTNEVFEYYIPKLAELKLINSNPLIAKIGNYLRQTQDIQIEQFDEFAKLFLTLDGKPKKTILPKEHYKSDINIKIQLEKVQSIIHCMYSNIVNLGVVDSSANMFSIAQHILCKYKAYKNSHNYLDYNDLIYFSCKLLQDSNYRDWVLYKLDSQIEHLLIDEAQDTSAEQWNIIHAVIEDFFTGIGAKADVKRSVFVVGDEKQSIYSFQGADLNNFLSTKLLLKNKLQQAKKEFLEIEMLTSYRSGPAINNFVYKFLLKLKEKALMVNMPSQLNIAKHSYPSRVEVLPAIVNEEKSEYFWPYYDKIVDEKDAAELEARRISTRIKNLLTSNIILPSTGKIISAEDIMILVPSRRAFIDKLTKNCQTLGIKVSGLDRISLKTSLSVLDIMSIFKYIIQPEDELNLSALLKSPIFGISEKELQKILILRLENETSMDNYMRENKKEYSEITDKLDLFKLLQTRVNFPELLHVILDVMGYQSVLLHVNGMQEIDAIEEFLNIAQDYHDNISSNLVEFAAWFDNTDIDVKRDLDVVHKQLRILTIHGSKGLESPVVILPETFSSPTDKGNYFWNSDSLLLCKDKKSNIVNNDKEQKNVRAIEEYWRLLYVALTRSKDYLIISGYREENSKNQSSSWYNLLLDVMDNMPNKIIQEDGTLIYQEGEFVFAKDPLNTTHQKDDTTDLKKPSGEFDIENFLSSRSRNTQVYKNSIEKQYGIVAHKILEDILINKNTALLYTHSMLKSLPGNLANTLTYELEHIFSNNKEVMSWFNYPLKIEQELLMEDSKSLTLGRVDLIILKPDEVMIVDYKTDHNPPTTISAIPNNYKLQLNSYAKSVKVVYPDKNITTYILWIKSGDLMRIL